ncbi:hypothetical protein GCM10009808_20060 [Microbacterium sediminicola]|uniref:SHS2 domain-containing protein n=1 Tax=Microbacterium sediminicola TaxID=415210 RepID=A0ABP4UB15_9MICO
MPARGRTLRSKTLVALEITEESVRAVEVTTGRTPKLIAAGEVPLPEGAAKDSEILDRDAVALALQRLWADAKLTGRDVVLGVGNRRILVREHATTLTNPAHIREALPLEVQDRLPVPVDQAVLDFIPTSQDADGVRGLLVAAVAEHMEELVDALTQARLRPTSIDLTAFGYARALRQLSGESDTAMLIGMGEHTTHIVIATGGIPRFVRVLPIDIVAGAETDGPDVAPERTAPSTPTAPLRRVRMAVGDDPAAPRALHADVQAALIDLIGRLRSTVSFYRDRPDAAAIDAVWVVGEHAWHPRLLESISRIAEAEALPVALGDLVPVTPNLPIPGDVGARLVGTAALVVGGAR